MEEAVLKDISLLVWLTQLGLSVAVPPAVCILLARRLQDSYGWGEWVLWVGIVFGVLLALDGLLVSLRTLFRLTKPKDKDEPPVSFNDHD